MHEVKVYDSSGNLKKVISIKALNKREDKKAEFPALFRRNKRSGKPPAIAPKPKAKGKTS